LVLALLLAGALLLIAGTVYVLATGSFAGLKLVAIGTGAIGIFVVLRALFYELGGSVAVFASWLIAGVAITAGGIVMARRSDAVAVAVMAMAAVSAYFVYLRLDEIPEEFVRTLPYVVTLVVVASKGQALRPPAQAGEPWFKGQQS